MARTALPLSKLLSGVAAVTTKLSEQIGTATDVVYVNEEVQKADVKLLDQLARALRKVPVATLAVAE